MVFTKELEFENTLIDYLSKGILPKDMQGETQMVSGEEGTPGTESVPNDDGRSPYQANGDNGYMLKGVKQWTYEPTIKTTEQLWDNFKGILERNNSSTLRQPLSHTEFNQVKQIISNLRTPYEAGQFLYGLNGVSQIEIDLDDGRHVFLTVFDQSQVGAGNTVYQIVNQIVRPPVIAGKQERRFDTTMLINGLPIIQIEEKADSHDVDEALNQMHQYIEENQYSGIFSTVQILVGITPHDVKYMANTTADKFNKDFAFRWQRKQDNKVVRQWSEFARLVLSIPMAHRLSTNYIILDGTTNKQMLKVMRPYQVYATQAVIEKLRTTDFTMGMQKVGYVWHTTGSGKTITSFKTAWLARQLPNVDKVVFVVDRIALTRQTNESYRAYDPEADGDMVGRVTDTENTRELREKLNANDSNIIVTSVQKLATLVKRKFTAPKKNIVFIVDEAHRSTGGDSFAMIQKAFPRSAWVGYSGTPMFDATTNGLRTVDIFGDLLHAYTIREAIADRNVLGFKVDFETTIDEDAMRDTYLPQFYHARYPEWTEEDVQEKIKHLRPEDMDDMVEPSFYDENPDHVRLVVEDIFKNWRNRSNGGKYNALLTTHVGGGRASAPMALMYYREFQRVNEQRRKEGKFTLKVGVTFSLDTSNGDGMVERNKGLFEAIQSYNAEFGTSFDMSDVAGYTQDLTSRLNRTASDKNFLDIGIVVDQLLTGFDAPEMNTLYVDRTLRDASLIQAYSRTNRMADMQEKPWGRIVNYRWPKQNEALMKRALSIYANRASSFVQGPPIGTGGDDDDSNGNNGGKVLAIPFAEEFEKVKTIVTRLADLTDEFSDLPPGDADKEEMLTLLRQYNVGMAKLKQYDMEEVSGTVEGFDYDHPEKLIEHLGMTIDQEATLTTSLANELKNALADRRGIPPFQIELRMTHVKDVKVDYDYLTELVEQLLNEVHNQQMDQAIATKEKITQFANGLDDQSYARLIRDAAEAIFHGHYTADNNGLSYPVRLTSSTTIIQTAGNVTIDRQFQDFRIQWGIIDVISSKEMRELFSRHTYGAVDDLDEGKQITNLLKEAAENYKLLARDENVQNMTKIKYRKNLRKAIYTLADAYVME